MAFTKSKYFKMAAGHYYFHLKSGQQNILMYRKSKEAAVDAYYRYVKVGKNCDWLGKWTGRKFEDNAVPEKPVD